jgi:hypothetical protein
MVDEDSSADLRAGMEIHPSKEPRGMSEDPGCKSPDPSPEELSDPVHPEHMKTGVTGTTPRVLRAAGSF